MVFLASGPCCTHGIEIVEVICSGSMLCADTDPRLKVLGCRTFKTPNAAQMSVDNRVAETDTLAATTRFLAPAVPFFVTSHRVDSG